MPLSQTTVVGRIMLPDNTPADITSLRFSLTGSDWEDDIWVARDVVEATLGEEPGSFTITLWPNEAGHRGNTRYRATVQLADGSVDNLPPLFIRTSELPIDIDDLVIEQSVIAAGYATRVVTQAQYDSLSSYAPNTIYLVRM